MVLAHKAHSTPGGVPRVKPFIGINIMDVSGMKGIPAWYLTRPAPILKALIAECLSGQCTIGQVCPDRVFGCVVYPAAEVSEPEMIKHTK